MSGFGLRRVYLVAVFESLVNLRGIIALIRSIGVGRFSMTVWCSHGAGFSARPETPKPEPLHPKPWVRV